jgi:2,3-bisphosphoglycerate-dependent phosphoglycerate mutase
VGILILARHGRSTANSKGVLAGRMPGVHLDDHGIAQAQAAGRRLVGIEVAAVASSPLDRCKETAKHITAQLSPRPPVRSDRRFTEVDYGDWTGLTLKKLAKEPLWGTVQRHPSAARFPEGESMGEMWSRATDAARTFVAGLTAGEGAVPIGLVVSHGDLIKAILADALGMHLDAFQRIVVDPGSLSVIRYTTERPYVIALNTHEGPMAELLRPWTTAHGPSSGATVGGSTGR